MFKGVQKLKKFICLFFSVLLSVNAYACNEEEHKYKSDLKPDISVYNNSLDITSYRYILNKELENNMLLKDISLGKFTDDFKNYNWSVYKMDYDSFLNFLTAPNFDTLNGGCISKFGVVCDDIFWTSYGKKYIINDQILTSLKTA